MPVEAESPGSGWNDSRAASVGSTHLGLSGYLATITSADEQSFLGTNFGSLGPAWVGGSDVGSEADWKWMDGPEAGVTFWFIDTVTYAAWMFRQPDNGGPYAYRGAENSLVFNWDGAGGWNDFTDFDADGCCVGGYIVEYSGSQASSPSSQAPAPGTLGLLGIGLACLGVLRRRKA